MDHFVERRRDESAHADNVGPVFHGGFHDLVTIDHDAEVNDLIAVAAENHADDVFANVVHVAFNGGDDKGGSIGIIFVTLFLQA